MATHGRLDVVVNSVGSSVVQPTMSLEARHWQRTLDVNLTGVFHACQAAVPHMRATIAAGLARQISIVTVASDDASFMVGANLVIDGGVTAGTGHPDVLALFHR